MKTGARLKDAAVACLLLAAACGLAQEGRAQSLVGKAAPVFTRRDLSGRLIHMRRLRGQVVLLNFWATWCAPCLNEMPAFDAWRRQFGAQGLAVIGISMDDDAAAARRMAERLKIEYPVAMGDARLAESYGRVLGLPKTFLIGRDGKVLAEFEGETDLKALEAAVKAALERR